MIPVDNYKLCFNFGMRREKSAAAFPWPSLAKVEITFNALIRTGA
jgi:hypothetical protein